MSDNRLRGLERAWTSDNSGENAAAYLVELLRLGEVTHRECVLAWRLNRIESLLQQDEHRSDLIPMGSRQFNPQSPDAARRVLQTLFGPVSALTNRYLEPEVSAIGDVVRSILMEEGLVRNPLEQLPPGIRPVGIPPRGHPEAIGREHGCSSCGFGVPGQRGHFPGCPLLRGTRCQPGAHLGPIDYSTAGSPVCERCGEAARAPGPSGCAIGLHDGPLEETTAGSVCTNCGSMVTPVRTSPTTSDA